MTSVDPQRAKLPAPLRAYTRERVALQKLPLKTKGWRAAFAGREDVYDALSEHVAAHDGIHRQFVLDHAARAADPVTIFLLAMAWGYAGVGYGPYRTTAILAQEAAEHKISHIVEQTRANGALAGWKALLGTHWIKGMNMSFGTKLLYYAGYHLDHRPRPLILDDRVRWSLYDLARGAVVPPGSGAKVTHQQYETYLSLAESWGADPTWKQEPDVVEYGLFELNGSYYDEVVIPAMRRRT